VQAQRQQSRTIHFEIPAVSARRLRVFHRAAREISRAPGAARCASRVSMAKREARALHP